MKVLVSLEIAIYGLFLQRNLKRRFQDSLVFNDLLLSQIPAHPDTGGVAVVYKRVTH